ncbi:MAG: asparagine synthase (glutamine-hydrolyzing) [Lachnospiraceae bacterium]|nr:asparagine synthase (glutamine-hydrolyzing) [Lachnospiraceae bacterium]
MCGILGGDKKTWDYESGIEAISHRGPDMRRVLREDRFSLAFARLSIIDLSEAGMQPMTSADGKVTIVYNGEIYGYGDLKVRLGKKYQFVSASDTEVILNAYMEYGDEFIDYIDGIFAIAVYDRRNQTVRLFRDRVGVKPLYYFYDGRHFGFASELKAIERMLDTEKLELDYTAIYDYLTYAYVPAPKTMYKNVRQLRPAHKIIYRITDRRISKQRRYWELTINDRVGRYRKDEALVDELRALIHKSVHEQMIADVPVGTFLSGGVDSSIVTYEALSANPDVESFSIGFDDKQYDESSYYKEFTKTFGNHSNEQVFDRGIYTDLYKELKNWYDEPFADTSAFPTYLVSKLAKEKVTVVLTGDGGDELFGGYEWYRQVYQPSVFWDSASVSRLYENYVSFDSPFYNSMAIRLFCETLQKACTGRGYMSKQEKIQFAKQWGIPRDYDDYWFLREYDRKDLPLGTRMLYLDFRTYLPEILTKVDRASMRVSLEARVPLLDKEIIEFAFSLSQEERCPGGEMKHMLRRAYPEIPKMIMYKSKQGFSIPKKYMGNKASPTKKILHEVWKIK